VKDGFRFQILAFILPPLSPIPEAICVYPRSSAAKIIALVRLAKSNDDGRGYGEAGGCYAQVRVVGRVACNAERLVSREQRQGAESKLKEGDHLWDYYNSTSGMRARYELFQDAWLLQVALNWAVVRRG
jgi:hypothetical protein